MLEVTDLVVAYGAIRALEGVSLSVPRSTIACLIGANGAGKTTLLRAVSGLVAPVAGRVRLDGVDVTGLAAEAIVSRGLGHVPEGRPNFATLSVRDNLLVGAYPARRRLGPAGVRAGMEHVFQLFPVLHRRRAQLAGSLSGGEQQMLAIGRVLMARPRVVLLDEPSMGLAPVLVRTILGRIHDLAAGGTTVLLVEQNARAALRIADHAWVLENGHVALDGPAAELAEHEEVKRAYLGRAGGGPGPRRTP